MSQENVEIVRSIYDAWAREELPGPPELLDPEIEYVNPTGAVEPGTHHGLDAFHRAVERVLESWETWQMEPELPGAGARERRRGGRPRVGAMDSARRKGRAIRVVPRIGRRV